MQGHWYTTRGSGTLPRLLIAVIAVIAASGAATGIAEAAATVVTIVLITAAIVVAIITAGLAAFVVHQVRHPDTRLIPRPNYHGFATGTERAAIEPEQPPMIVNNYFGGSHIHHGSHPGTAGNLTPLIQGAITGSGPRSGPAAS
jgi:hypothetical protein